MEQDGLSDRSEREAHDEWDTTANENGGRLTEESDVEQTDESPGPQATAYIEQGTEEMAEVRGYVHAASWLYYCSSMNLSGFEMLLAYSQTFDVLLQVGEASQVETVSEENKGLIWGLLKQLRPGMDLSKVVLPTFILEPRSFLDKLSDYYYHANLLSQSVAPHH